MGFRSKSAEALQCDRGVAAESVIRPLPALQNFVARDLPGTLDPTSWFEGCLEQTDRALILDASPGDAEDFRGFIVADFLTDDDGVARSEQDRAIRLGYSDRWDDDSRS